MKQLLMQAREEISRLRRDNEILRAKVEMIDLFACLLHTHPARVSVGMGTDVEMLLLKEIAEHERLERAAHGDKNFPFAPHPVDHNLDVPEIKPKAVHLKD